MTDPHDYVSAASAVLRENIAKTIWLAEYRRATGKERGITWYDVAEDDRLKYLFVADAIVGVIPAPAQLSKEQITAQVLLAMSDKVGSDTYGVSHALKINKGRAEKAAESILSLFTSQPSPAATVETKDLAIEVARNRIAELVNERDAVLARCSATSELVQQLREKATWRQDVHSDLHRAAADEIKRLRAEPQGLHRDPGEEDVAIALFLARHHGLTNIMPWDDIEHDGRDYWRTIARNLMRTHRVVPASQPSPAATVDPEAPSLNREGREHPSYDNPRDPFASPDRLPPSSSAGTTDAGCGAAVITPWAVDNEPGRDFSLGLKSLSGLRTLTPEQSDFLHDAAEEFERLRDLPQAGFTKPSLASGPTTEPQGLRVSEEALRNAGCPSDRRGTVGDCHDAGICGCSLPLTRPTEAME